MFLNKIIMPAALALASLVAVGCDQPPNIERVLVSRGVLLPGQQAVISVTVQDESGLENVTGVQLFSDDLNYWYGSLGEVSNGVFETAIDWGRLNEHVPIFFDFPIKRSLVVIVEDNDGGTDRRNVSFELTCRAAEKACNGNCYPATINCADI